MTSGAKAAGVPDNVKIGTLGGMNLVAAVPVPVEGTYMITVVTQLAAGSLMRWPRGPAVCRLS